MKIKKWMDCIGNTPIVELCHIEENENSLAHMRRSLNLPAEILESVWL